MTLPLPSGPRRVSVTLVDTMLLAPAGHQSLGALGEMLGLPKLDLPAGAITRMRSSAPRSRSGSARTLSATPRSLHDTHSRSGATSASSARSAALPPPPTLGAAAVNLARTVAGDRGIDLGAVLGRRGRRIAPEVGDHLTTFAECFHGGRNEAFWVGYTPRTTLHDVDLCGAYATALAHIREPGWGDAAVTATSTR